MTFLQPEDRLESSESWLSLKSSVIAFYRGGDCNAKVCSRHEESGHTIDIPHDIYSIFSKWVVLLV